MRIFEITDKNKTIIGISGINIDFEPEYNFLVNLLSALIPLKSPYRNQNALGPITDFENRIEQLQQNRLIDKLDPDIISLIDKLNKMKAHVTQLKDQLIF